MNICWMLVQRKIITFKCRDCNVQRCGILVMETAKSLSVFHKFVIKLANGRPESCFI